MYYVLWIINPLLRLWLLSRLVRNRVAPDLMAFRVYLLLWVLADVFMALCWSNQVFCWYAQESLYSAFYLLHLLIAIGCVSAIRAWSHPARILLSGTFTVAIILSIAFTLGTDSWAAWEWASGWADALCWIMILAYFIWEEHKPWPYAQIVRGLALTVLSNLALQLWQGNANPAPWMRVAYQVSGTMGLVYWLVSMSNGRRIVERLGWR